ncbi:hypothetical protein BYZ73_19690 [Rhodovulum viride]|uniref:Uncharacterized protein n=2 Tax=Rhodovulum TaxID=34008 RepID=A0ABX9DB83_9RHOB|nr:hypothetical protein BYZ73_19690 [Rhodovulum viride]
MVVRRADINACLSSKHPWMLMARESFQGDILSFLSSKVCHSLAIEAFQAAGVREGAPVPRLPVRSTALLCRASSMARCA